MKGSSTRVWAIVGMILVLALTAALVGRAMGTRRTRRVRQTPTLLKPRTDGVYEVVEETTETFAELSNGGSVSYPFPQTLSSDKPVYISEDLTLLEILRRGVDTNQPCGTRDGCREIRFDKNEHVLWYMNRLREEVDAASLDELRTLPGVNVDALSIVDDSPLTLRTNEYETVVVGFDEGLLDVYLHVLVAYKKAGRPLPRLDPTSDYTRGS